MGRPGTARPGPDSAGPIGPIIYSCRAGPAHVPRPQARARPAGQFGELPPASRAAPAATAREERRWPASRGSRGEKGSLPVALRRRGGGAAATVTAAAWWWRRRQRRSPREERDSGIPEEEGAAAACQRGGAGYRAVARRLGEVRGLVAAPGEQCERRGGRCGV
ncbi:hypothetical protein PVAP13_3NG124001 [Panicum virgatum]|uniref:Uncharacterized protein n=1 Tax=Panicum virgatum TaxID=38727 RepID=A0A8T0U640_PANVG|nr:hypothetical protein PVAP13_3NG124001 [Panicum virgatum]